jgi:haloalkane dehalogenase
VPPWCSCTAKPTWSFVWRKVVARLLESGHRCIAPDLPGFGRSDKPVDDDWYSYARHTDAVATLLVDLDLHEVTLVMEDWGGPIGLRMATLEQPDRVARLVAMDTGIFTGQREMSEAWHRFAAFVERTPDLPIGRLVAGGCRRPPSPEVIAAYEAPFPDARHNAGARAFPRLIPQSPEAPWRGGETCRRGGIARRHAPVARHVGPTPTRCWRPWAALSSRCSRPPRR